MTIEEIRQLILTPEYDFLRTEPILRDKISILTLGGSHAYGTNIEGSDVDIRGMIIPTAEDIIAATPYDQYIETNTDTVFYSLDKQLKLLAECNPNTVEILGCLPEQYIILDKYGKMILDNKEIFLSKRAISTFAGYATQQLYRLKQQTVYAMTPEEFNAHIAKVVNGMKQHISSMFGYDVTDRINAHVVDDELVFDIHMDNIQDEQFIKMMDQIRQTVKSYRDESKRNKKAAAHDKMNKHAMHLIRLYMMGIDLLTKKEIITYRSGDDHKLLMDIRNKKYFDADGKPNAEFFEILNEYERKFDEAAKTTDLPDKPDIDTIEKLRFSIREDILRNR